MTLSVLGALTSMSMDPRGSLDSVNVSFVCASVFARASVHPLSLSHCWTYAAESAFSAARPSRIALRFCGMHVCGWPRVC